MDWKHVTSKISSSNQTGEMIVELRLSSARSVIAGAVQTPRTAIIHHGASL